MPTGDRSKREVPRKDYRVLAGKADKKMSASQKSDTSIKSRKSKMKQMEIQELERNIDQVHEDIDNNKVVREVERDTELRAQGIYVPVEEKQLPKDLK